eukprot:g2688.t1
MIRHLASPAFLTEILTVLDVLAGEKADSERKRAVRAALFEGNRRSDESIAQYALRRESQFEVASRYITLPDDVKGILLEEQSGLSKQTMQNLRVLTKGQHSYSEVKKALHVLDVDDESMIKPGKVNYFEDIPEYAETDFEEDDEEVFLAIENERVVEEEAVALLAELHQDRRRTWKENKLLKAARKKDRRHFDDRGSRPARPFNKRRLSIDELKKITFCSNCGKKGHWREDCSEPIKESSHHHQHHHKGNRTNAFVFLGISEEAKSSAAFFLGALSSTKSVDGACFLELNPGQAIVDPGASQDLIGLPSFERLQEKLAQVGLQAIKLDEIPGKAAGVGGSAKTLFMALSPCILGGQPGVIKLTVVEDDVPQLLSIGLLEHGEAVIDTGTDKILFRKFGTEARMTRLPSGHRTLDVAEWSGEDFPAHVELSRIESLLREKEWVMRCVWGEDRMTMLPPCQSVTVTEEFREGQDRDHLVQAMELGNDEQLATAAMAQARAEVAQMSLHQLLQGTWPSMHGTALFASVARMNHSCAPNVKVTFPRNSSTLLATSVLNISAGDELHLIRCQEADVQTRRRRLLEYGFTCCCSRCLAEDSTVLRKSQKRLK